MADKNTVYMSEKQKVKEITDKLEAGLKELFESEKYKSYLSTMSKFHNYSFNNTLLIAMQKPEATLVAGYQAWQKNFERHVNKGEKAIRILAPAPYKIKEERDKLDPVTGEMMFDENGMPQKEETEVTIPAFRAVSVFDVSQTDGKPIPELEVNELLSTVEGYEDFVQALMNISPVPIAFEDIPGDSKGYFSTAEKRIAVQENMSESQTLKTMVHEVAHSMLHDKEVNQSMDIPVKDRNTKEVEAESVAFTVCQHFGIDVELVDVVVSGSRCRGLEKAGSDLDVVVEYKGREHEDDLFNVFNEDGLMIGGVKVDINPITEGKTGTLATYLPEVESYLAEKQAMQKASAVEAIPEKTITLTVAECGEFHSLGEFHENIASVEEAIAVWKSIPPERMNGIPSIGINIHTEGTERYEDVEMDILSGKVIDLEVLDYVPDITDEPKAIEVIAELIDKLPDIEVRGSLEKWQAAILASQIDQFSYDYDTYQYQDTVEDREAQVANITEDIRNGNTGYLNDFLNAVISEGVREGITDIFGEGVEIDDSEAVQTARRAKELLDKLAEYKPLAKVEELEEQNYNMIDNVLNNGAEKKEQEQIKGRISIKEKLAEKKAVIEQRDKAERTSPEKETEKKSQREM